MGARKSQIADGQPGSWLLEPEPDRGYLALATFFQLRTAIFKRARGLSPQQYRDAAAAR